jgi:hypothetical protein
MKKQAWAKPTSVDIGQQAIDYTVVTSLEKKYPGHDFAVFGKRLYIDDKDIPFVYSDDNLSSLQNILSELDQEVAKIV